MSNHNRLMAREIIVGTIVALATSTVGAGVGIYVASAKQEQRIAALEASFESSKDDHEARIRVVEQTLIRLDGNVQWIKEFVQKKWP